MIYLKAYLGALATFLVIDAIWLGFIAKSFYAEQLGALMRDSPNMAAAAAFYAIYVGGVVLFAVRPALATESHWLALGLGAALGFMAYGTYDVTNYATLKGWPIAVVVIDILWGTALTALSALCGYLLTRVW